MSTNPPKYQKPKITAKKIKISFFLTPSGFLDDFNLLGDVYATSHNRGDGCSSAGECGCSSESCSTCVSST